MIPIELPVCDVITHVSTWRSLTTTYIFNSLSPTHDWVNRPYEILLKSYHTDELNSSVSYIYCWYITYWRLKLFLSPVGDLLIHLAVAILDELQSHRFTVSLVAMAYGQLANSPRWHWYTVVISYMDELLSHPKEIETILLWYGWDSMPEQKYACGNG